MAIVVLPRIEQENPFGELAEVIGEQALPYLIKLYANKDKIAKLSDTELTDFVEVLQRQAPELVADGKINWAKVNEWAQSDDQTKLQVASFLFDAKRVREDFANAPLIAKLQAIDVAGSINPQELNKIFVAGKMQQKLTEAIGNSNLPDEYKLLFLANIEKFVEKPHLIPVLEKILGGTTQAGNTTETQDSSGMTGSWQFSLDGSKPFGIQLEEPILTPPQVSPPQIPVVKQQPVVKQGGGGTGQRLVIRQGGGGTADKDVKGATEINQPQKPNSSNQTSGGVSLERLAELGASGLGYVNSLLLGALLFGLARNPQAFLQARALLRGAQRGFQTGVGKTVETAKKVLSRDGTKEKRIEEIKKNWEKALQEAQREKQKAERLEQIKKQWEDELKQFEQLLSSNKGVIKQTSETPSKISKKKKTTNKNKPKK